MKEEREKCPCCGAPMLREGEQHAVVLPVRDAPKWHLEVDEDGELITVQDKP